MKIILTGTIAMLLLSAAPPPSHATNCGKASPPQSTIVEVVTFNPNVTDAAFMTTVNDMELAFLCKSPGFVRRTLSKGEDGTWFDYVEWATLDSAKAAMDASMADKRAAAFVQAIVPESVKVNHWKMTSSTQ
jgi:hypothetical protein